MICDPPVNVYKGYCMPRDTEAYILSCGLKNALYSIRAADLKADLFGDLIPCSFQQPADKDKKRSQGLMGAEWGGAIRQELYYLLKDDKDVHFTFGSVQVNGVNDAGKGMGSSKFCLNIARDIPSSNRLFDAIASHCVPVIISDKMELPFEDVLDYSEFYIFVRASDAVKKGFLLNLLRGITRENWTRMWERLKHITRHFEYQYPSQPGDAVDMIWQAVSRKMSLV